MRKQRRIDLNLATHPMKNRRFFFLLVGILVVLVVVIVSDGAWTFGRYSRLNRNIRENAEQIEKMINDAKREELRLTRQIEEAEQTHQDEIDLINTLILKKSFSWVEFLSALEEALPPSCYIETLTPTLKENNQMEVRLRVAAPSLDELLTLNQNLYKEDFKSIRIMSEAMNEAGLLIAQITLTYERTI